jgi:hypothetical protein
MRAIRTFCLWQVLVATAFLSACATREEIQPAAEPALAGVTVRVDETAMLPLLGYYQLLQHMTPQELLRERTILLAIPQTAPAQVRMAMLLGQVRGPMDLARAFNLLDGLLKSNTPEAASLYPLVRLLLSQYQERWRLDQERIKTDQERVKLDKKIELLTQQLKDSQRKSDELQEKLDAMANIEHSIPALPTGHKKLPGPPR